MIIRILVSQIDFIQVILVEADKNKGKVSNLFNLCSYDQEQKI